MPFNIKKKRLRNRGLNSSWVRPVVSRKDIGFHPSINQTHSFLIRANLSCKHFTNINSFNFCHNILDKFTIFIWQVRKWGTGKLNNWPNFIGLVSSKAGTPTRPAGSMLCSWPHIMLYFFFWNTQTPSNSPSQPIYCISLYNPLDTPQVCSFHRSKSKATS